MWMNPYHYHELLSCLWKEFQRHNCPKSKKWEGGASPGKIRYYKSTWCSNNIVNPDFIFMWFDGRGARCLPQCTIYGLLGYWGMTVILYGIKTESKQKQKQEKTVLTPKYCYPTIKPFQLNLGLNNLLSTFATSALSQQLTNSGLVLFSSIHLRA